MYAVVYLKVFDGEMSIVATKETIDETRSVIAEQYRKGLSDYEKHDGHIIGLSDALDTVLETDPAGGLDEETEYKFCYDLHNGRCILINGEDIPVFYVYAVELPNPK